MRLICLLIFFVFNYLFSYGQTENLNNDTIAFKKLTYITSSADTINYSFGFLKVPENRNSLQSNVVDLAVLKLQSKNPSNANPILFLSGGPGESGIDYIKEAYFQKLIFELQQNHDIILLDQRGTGRSLPSLKFKLPDSDNTKLFLSPDRIIDLWDEAASIGASDFKERKIDINGYNAVQSSFDLDDLAFALGTEKLNILAFSYGTHVALSTAKLFPSLVNSMVLIGPSGLNHMHHLPSSYDAQLERISALAAGDSLINKQVPDFLDLLTIVLKKLDENPVIISIKDIKAKKIIQIPVGKFGLQLILRFDTGDSNDFILFPALLYGIENGDYRLLQQFAERRYNQFNGSSGSGILAVRQASGSTEKRYKQIIREGKSALLGNAINTPDIYAGWKNVDLGDDFRSPFTCQTPTLFISGTLDSNTPSSNVDEINKGFKDYKHIKVENAGHEDMLSNELVQKVIVDFTNKKKILYDIITMPKPIFTPIF